MGGKTTMHYVFQHFSALECSASRVHICILR